MDAVQRMPQKGAITMKKLAVAMSLVAGTLMMAAPTFAQNEG